MRARLRAGLEGRRAIEGARTRTGHRLSDQVPDGKASSGVPAHDPGAGCDCLAVTHAANWRDDGGPSEGPTTVVGASWSLSDAGLGTSRVRGHRPVIGTASSLDAGAVTDVRRGAPSPQGRPPPAQAVNWDESPAPVRHQAFLTWNGRSGSRCGSCRCRSSVAAGRRAGSACSSCPRRGTSRP
jgi:hypothetical protein